MAREVQLDARGLACFARAKQHWKAVATGGRSVLKSAQKRLVQVFSIRTGRQSCRQLAMGADGLCWPTTEERARRRQAEDKHLNEACMHMFDLGRQDASTPLGLHSGEGLAHLSQRKRLAPIGRANTSDRGAQAAAKKADGRGKRAGA